MSVFISYSHDSDEHAAKVLALAKRLRGDGVDVVLDQEVKWTERGWAEWSRREMNAAEVVLIVCTETYRRRAEGQEAPGKGLGAAFEAGLIFSEIYKASGVNRKYIPVVFSEQEIQHRPQLLERYHYFLLDRDYPKLLNLLKPPAPSKPAGRWTVPDGVASFFPRDEFLEKLHELVAPVRAIQGLGGLGKTQTAIAFAHKYRDEFTSGFWMTAHSPEALVAGFAALGDPNEKDLAKTAKDAKRWFEENSGWLLILDNVESWSDVKEWLPVGKRGLVLVTTRLHATGTIAQGLDLPKLTPYEGATFLLARAKVANPNEADRVAARKISEQVDGLLLALDQAGAFMEEVQTSAAEYLKLYGAKLRARRGEASDHDSVTVTYTLAFEKLSERAKDIVRMCAFLAPEAIPEEILLDGKEPDLDFREAVADAAKFSLIQRSASDRTIDVHRLVQDVVKDQMDEVTRRNGVVRSIKRLSEVLPDVEFKTRQQYARLLPSVLAALRNARQLGVHSRLMLHLLTCAGYYLQDRAQFNESAPLYELALALSRRLLGDAHPTTLRNLNNLATLYSDQHRDKEAEQLLTQLTQAVEGEGEEAKLDLAVALNNLGAFYCSRARFPEAQPLLERALAIKEQHLGRAHRDVAGALNNLGWAYANLHRAGEAEALYLRALAIVKREFGESHPHVAATLNNLGALYASQGRASEAEPLAKQAFDFTKREQGPHHPDTRTAMNNYTQLLIKLGRVDEARMIVDQLNREISGQP